MKRQFVPGVVQGATTGTLGNGYGYGADVHRNGFGYGSGFYPGTGGGFGNYVGDGYGKGHGHKPVLVRV